MVWSQSGGSRTGTTTPYILLTGVAKQQFSAVTRRKHDRIVTLSNCVSQFEQKLQNSVVARMAYLFDDVLDALRVSRRRDEQRIGCVNYHDVLDTNE